ncbi:ABC transporter ATP-binding protein [Natronospora cellulosivora (SeqCode)]
MKEDNIILKVENLKKYFPIKQGFMRREVGQVKAVDDISFYIKEGETVGLVGESGCGKSTTGHCLLKLKDASAGSIHFKQNGEMIDMLSVDKDQLKDIRKDIQMIFQDPNASLSPRMTIQDIIAEPLVVHKIGSKKERREIVKNLLEKVGLKSYQMNRYPHEFSGGQRQRIGVARALTLNPKLIVCDEPVSALDVSVQAQVINLLKDLQKEYNLTYLFIAHDLSVVEHISDRVIVMYLGKIVEIAESDEIYQRPKHPYTEALLGSIPEGDPRRNKKRIKLPGSIGDPSNPPTGCNLHPRCKYAQDICRQKEPELKNIANGSEHYVACHFAEELELAGYDNVDNNE